MSLPAPYFAEGGITLYQGDCLDVMRGLPECSIDAVVTDPPYGIRFMGQSWDGADIAKATVARRLYRSDDDPRAGELSGHYSPAIAAGKYDLSKPGLSAFQTWSCAWGREALRVAKPGAHLVAFCSPRTVHRLTCGLEDAGWEIRDQLLWLFGGGFPKSLNLSGDWRGWGTGLKPGYEPIVLARKPLDGTVAENMARWGTGALHIDAGRINMDPWTRSTTTKHDIRGGRMHAGTTDTVVNVGPQNGHVLGRWPANLLHDGSPDVLEAFPEAPGQLMDVKLDPTGRKTQRVYGAMARGHEASAHAANNGTVGFAMKPGGRRLDCGSASRFFYCAKARPQDRGHEVWDALPLFGESEQTFVNTHPTVKPLSLMRYLLALVSRDGATVLDHFAGSGSTLVAGHHLGRCMLGVEREAEYLELATYRCRRAVSGTARDAGGIGPEGGRHA